MSVQLSLCYLPGYPVKEKKKPPPVPKRTVTPSSPPFMNQHINPNFVNSPSSQDVKLPFNTSSLTQDNQVTSPQPPVSPYHSTQTPATTYQSIQTPAPTYLSSQSPVSPCRTDQTPAGSPHHYQTPVRFNQYNQSSVHNSPIRHTPVMPPQTTHVDDTDSVNTGLATSSTTDDVFIVPDSETTEFPPPPDLGDSQVNGATDAGLDLLTAL